MLANWIAWLRTKLAEYSGPEREWALIVLLLLVAAYCIWQLVTAP